MANEDVLKFHEMPFNFPKVEEKDLFAPIRNLHNFGLMYHDDDPFIYITTDDIDVTSDIVINNFYQQILDHITNEIIHVTQSDRDRWDMINDLILDYDEGEIDDGIGGLIL